MEPLGMQRYPYWISVCPYCTFVVPFVIQCVCEQHVQVLVDTVYCKRLGFPLWATTISGILKLNLYRIQRRHNSE